MTQPPALRRPLPQMRRSKLIAQAREPIAIELEILEDLVAVARRKLAVEAAHERHRLVAREVLVPRFLRRVIRGAPEAELDERRVVVKPVDLVVEAVVLAVGALGARRIRRKAGV